MFERLTDRARKAMALANQEARRLHHEHVGTEHLLLGLTRENDIAAMVLKDLGVDVQTLHAEIEKLVPSKTDTIPLGEPPQTPRAKEAITYAVQEARSLGQNYVGTEHLLLGLIRDREATAARALMSLGLKLDAIREKVLELHPKGGRTDQIGQLRMRFTDRARKVMALANQEAQRFNHEYIGTEHILLGLMKEGSGVGVTVLKNLGTNVPMLRTEVEKRVQSGPDLVTMGKRPQTPRARRVIEYAIEEARALNHNYVGTEHILLGLLRESEGIAAQVLMNLGVRLEDVRNEVLKLHP
jgi:ATP-dependent Clp protease ATP-binding subunit ClpA